MRTLVACLILAPVSWLNVARSLPRTIGEESDDTCNAMFSVTVWGVVGALSTAVLVMNWGDL